MTERKTILVVDDKEINRVVLEGIFQSEYEIISAEDGEEAIECLKNYSQKLAIVLLDVFMPKVDGFGVLQYMQEEGLDMDIPVVLITAEDSIEIDEKGYQYNVADIVRKPFVPKIVRRRVHNVIALYDHTRNLEHLVKKQVRDIERKNADLKIKNQEIEETLDSLIDAISNIVEFRNREPDGHIKRIKEYTKILAQEVMESLPEYGLTSEDVKQITKASALHDIGKIAIPEAILHKPNSLDEEEFEEMKRHTTLGCELLDTFNFIKSGLFYNYCKTICRSHHERWDGKGYPDGLKGDDIPVSAQIVSIADAYDALTVKRCYKESFDHEIVMEMINNGNCGVFNPKLLECFNRITGRFEKIMQEVSDLLI